MRLPRYLLVTIVAILGAFPAFFVAAPEAMAFCSLIGDGYSGDTYVVAYECDSVNECADWMGEMSTGLNPETKWEMSCSVADAPEEEDNPLGEPPSLIPEPPVQVERLERACYADSCNGLDPEGSRCQVDAYTIYSEDVIINSDWSSSKGSGPWGIAEMRYSPTCHSNWVRFTPYTTLDDVIRFLFNAGLVASSDADPDAIDLQGDGAGLGTYYAVPYIWRLGVDNSLHGPTGSSDPLAWQVTTWTSMVSADGQTCWSVEIHWRANHHAGAGDTDHIGTFDADCVS